MLCPLAECEGLLAVAKGDETYAGQADALGEFSACFLAVDGPVDINGSAAALQIGVEIGCPLVVPIAVLTEDEDVGSAELVGVRPFPGGRDFSVSRACEKFGPAFLEGGIVVLA